MPLQDVSDDQLMINWLRQSGHAHLLDDQLHHANPTSSPSPLTAPQNYPPPPTAPHNYPPPTIASPSYPPPTMSSSSPVPQFGGGPTSGNPLLNMFSQSALHPQTNFPQTTNYGGAGSPSPPIIPTMDQFNAPSYDHQSSPLHFNASPTQFLAPNMGQQQLDMDIEVKCCL